MVAIFGAEILHPNFHDPMGLNRIKGTKGVKGGKGGKGGRGKKIDINKLIDKIKD